MQIAKAHGAHVIGTARKDKHGFLKELGADELIDYTSTDFVSVARDIDIVLDPISGGYGPRSLETLTADGVLLDVRGTGPDRTAVRERARERGLRYVEFGFTPSGTDLREITALVERGALRGAVEQVLPLEEAAKAHQLSETGRVKGKIALTVAIGPSPTKDLIADTADEAVADLVTWGGSGLQQDAFAEKIEVSPPIALSLDQLDSRVLTLGLPGTPGHR